FLLRAADNPVPFINDKLNSERLNNRAANTEDPAATMPTSSDRPAQFKSRFLFNPGDVMKKLHQRIVGQDHVLAEIAGMLKTVKADIGDPQRPLYVGFLVG